MRHFYPRPPRGGRPAGIEMGAFIHNISIHALREEGDMRQPHPLRRAVISIHALREEGDKAPTL